MDLPILVAIVVAPFIINAAIPPLLLLTQGLLHFWTRGRFSPTWAGDLQYKKYRTLTFDCNWDVEYFFTWLLYDVVLGAAAAFALGQIVFKQGLMAFIVTGILAALLFLPRIGADVMHSLRYNFKTKDSDRIAKLERELSELKNK